MVIYFFKVSEHVLTDWLPVASKFRSGSAENPVWFLCHWPHECLWVWNNLPQGRSPPWRCVHNRLALLVAVRKTTSPFATVKLLPCLSLCQNPVSPSKDTSGSPILWAHASLPLISSNIIPFDLSAPSRCTKLLFSAVYPLVYSLWGDSDSLWHLEEW